MPVYEPVDLINSRLADFYGRDVSLDNPNYRIVWSTDQFEHRKGTYEDYDENGTFIRRVQEVRYVEKYPFYPNRWILESLQFNELNPELFTKISYEPLWVFGEAGSDPQPLWRAVQLIVNISKAVEKVKRTQKDLDEEEFQKVQKERQLFKEILQNESPYIAGALKDGAAVVVPSNYGDEK
jgi:hypothetical protein